MASFLARLSWALVLVAARTAAGVARVATSMSNPAMIGWLKEAVLEHTLSSSAVADQKTGCSSTKSVSPSSASSYNRVSSEDSPSVGSGGIGRVISCVDSSGDDAAVAAGCDELEAPVFSGNSSG